MRDRAVMDRCEAFSNVGQGTAGVLVLRGFAGNPSSMTPQAERSCHVATQDFDRELINECSLAFNEHVTGGS